jgi:hypothetical protein
LANSRSLADSRANADADADADAKHPDADK